MTIKTKQSIQVGIIASLVNKEHVNTLLDGVHATLNNYGYLKKNITTLRCSGVYEIVNMAHVMLKNKPIDGLILLGCVIKGETLHFDLILNTFSYGMAYLMTNYTIPITNGVIFADNIQQVKERTYTNRNKGIEAAQALNISLETILNGID